MHYAARETFEHPRLIPYEHRQWTGETEAESSDIFVC